MKIITLHLLLVLSPFILQAQKKNKRDISNDASQTQKLERNLYLSQIKAAEALYQLNEIAEAKGILAETSSNQRGLEWDLLNSLADQSSTTLQHNKSVAFVTVSPDGQWIASGSTDSTIWIWDFVTGKKLFQLKGHGGQVSTLAFSPDSKLLASGSTDKSVKLWDTNTWKEKGTYKEQFSQGIYQLKFSPNGKELAVCTWERTKANPPVLGFTKILEVETGKVIKRFDQDNHPSATLDYSPDGSKLMVATWGFIMYYYDLATDKLEWTYDLTNPQEYTAMNSADISPDGKRIVLGTKDNRVRVIDAATGKLIYQIDPWNGHAKWVNSVRFIADGKYFASGSDDQLLMIWETETGKMIQKLRGHVGPITSLDVYPQKNVVVTASRDGSVKVWNWDISGALSFDVCDNGPWYAPVCDDGKYIAAACSDKKIGIWNMHTGLREKSFDSLAANCAVFSKDGKYLAAAGHDALVHLFDLSLNKEIFTLKGHSGSIYGIDYLNSRKLIATASGDKTLRVWKADSGEQLNSILFEESGPYAVKFTFDGRYLVAGLSNGVVKVLETESWKEMKSWKAGTSINILTIDQAGKRLVTAGGGGQLFVSDIETGKVVYALKGHQGAIYGVDFNPDGKYIASVSYDRTLRLWDSTSGDCTLTMHGFKDEVFTVSFLKTERKLVLTETQGVVHILDY